MNRSRSRLKALGLCVIAMGLVVINAGGAQAESGANWMLNGSNVTFSLSPSVAIFLPFLSASLATKIAGAGVKYECGGAELAGTKLETEGKLTSGGKVKFVSCKTFLNGSLSAICQPHSAGQAPGTILTNAGKGLMVLHGGEPVILVEPSSSSAFVTILHGEECSLPESVPVMGKLVVEDVFGLGDKEETEHWLTPLGVLSNLFVISNTAEHSATASGTAIARLSGSHVGNKWSGLPG